MDTTKAEFKASYGLSSQLPERDRAEIVFSGRSNVGKSSLINKLCNRKSLARVSSTPGKTATINFYTVGGVYLVDLPGYGYAKVAQGERQRWDKLIDSYFERGRRCALLVQLLDSRHDAGVSGAPRGTLRCGTDEGRQAEKKPICRDGGTFCGNLCALWVQGRGAHQRG